MADLDFESSDFFHRWELVYEIEFETGKKIVSRGNWIANSILKRAALWENCCSFLFAKTREYFSVALFEMSHFSNVQNWHTVLSLLEKDCGFRKSPLWGCWIFFFFTVEDVSAFLVDVRGKMCQRLMWCKPHAVGCSRVSLKAVCLLCTREFYCFLLCSDLSIITISWSWLIFLAEPIRNTSQVNQALKYLSSCVFWPSSFCIGLLCFTFMPLLTSVLTAAWSEYSQNTGLPFRAWDQTTFSP